MSESPLCVWDAICKYLGPSRHRIARQRYPVYR